MRNLDKTKTCYEDALPEDITDEEYDTWFKESWVNGVRIGYELSGGS